MRPGSENHGFAIERRATITTRRYLRFAWGQAWSCGNREMFCSVNEVSSNCIMPARVIEGSAMIKRDR